MKTIIILIFLTNFFWIGNILGQLPINNSSNVQIHEDSLNMNTIATTQAAMLEIIPQCPQASSLLRFGEYPVSLYTGLIDISVPIYTIEANGVKVPIELKYHTSGIKYDDVSLSVGLGWTLSAGGIITHTINGVRDDQYVKYIKNVGEIDPYGRCEPPYSTDLYYLVDVACGINSDYCTGFSGPRDGEYDTYSFSFLNHHGKFIIPDQNTKKAVFIPAHSFLIELDQYKNVTFIDDQGICYVFQAEFESSSQSYSNQYLQKIITADKADTVEFIYKRLEHTQTILRPYLLTPYVYRETKIFDSFYGVYNYEIIGTPNNGWSSWQYNPPVLDKITFRNGKILFEYDQIFKRILKSVKVYNSRNTSASLVQTSILYQSKFTNNENKLDSLVFIGGSQTYSYKFDYNGNPNSIRNRAGIDYWGYFNGATNRGSYCPSFTIPSLGIDPFGRSHIYSNGMDRDAHESSMQQGILNKIVYPTKGYTRFFYEAHKYDNKDYGGLRIKEIYNYDVNNELIEKKWYKYGVNESGNGRPACYQPQINDLRTNTLQILLNDIYADRIDRLDKIATFSTFPKKGYVTSSGSSVVYSHVTEYSGYSQTSNGKIIYTYSDYPDNIYITNRGQVTDHYLRERSWANGLLLGKIVKDNSENDVYTLYNSYKEINTAEYMNLRVIPHTKISGYAANEMFSCVGHSGSKYAEINRLIGGSFHDYYNYYITTGLPVLASSTEKQDGVTRKTTYTNHNVSGFPLEIQYEESNASKRTVKNKYPDNFSVSGNVYDKMIKKNILSPVIEQDICNDQSSLMLTKNNYYNWSINVFAPISVETKSKGQASSEVRIRYHNYDSYGNPTCVSYEDGPIVVYIWGYKGQYPVAKIESTSKESSFYNTVINAIGTSNITILSGTPTDAQVKGIFTTLRSNSSLTGALITSYTHKPLVGITSDTDPSGRTIFYEYDDFGRLKRTKDEEGKILQEYDYHYAQ